MALQLAQLKKNYIGPDGSVVSVIDIDNLAVADGEHVALIGTSGSGKTTLLHMIAGIVAADTGKIEYDFSQIPAGGLTQDQARPAGIDYRGTTPQHKTDIAKLS